MHLMTFVWIVNIYTSIHIQKETEKTMNWLDQRDVECRHLFRFSTMSLTESWFPCRMLQLPSLFYLRVDDESVIDFLSELHVHHKATRAPMFSKQIRSHSIFFPFNSFCNKGQMMTEFGAGSSLWRDRFWVWTEVNEIT